MLSVQFMTSNIIFSSLTYVLPLIYYILFHSNPYDELIGCQNLHSFEARFTDSVSMKRKFLVVYLNFPQLKNVNYAIHNEKLKKQPLMYADELKSFIIWFTFTDLPMMNLL